MEKKIWYLLIYVMLCYSSLIYIIPLRLLEGVCYQ